MFIEDIQFIHDDCNNFDSFENNQVSLKKKKNINYFEKKET